MTGSDAERSPTPPPSPWHQLAPGRGHPRIDQRAALQEIWVPVGQGLRGCDERSWRKKIGTGSRAVRCRRPPEDGQQARPHAESRRASDGSVPSPETLVRSTRFARHSERQGFDGEYGSGGEPVGPRGHHSLAPLARERRIAVVAAELAIPVKVVEVGQRTPLARPEGPLVASRVGKPLSVGKGRPNREH